MQNRNESAPRMTDRDAVDAEGTCTSTDTRADELERDLHALCHDLRSPLVALQGFARLLEEDHAANLPEDGQRFVNRIQEAGRRIEWRLNDIEALTKVSEEPRTPSWIDPRPEFEMLAAEIKPALDAVAAELRLPVEPPLIHCDRAQLRILLIHLCGNALQFAAPGAAPKIQIEVREQSDACELVVVDDGPGMSADLRARAFELFHACGDRNRRIGPTRESSGLGLALVDRIARGHGGCAWIENGPTGGTAVHVRLPHPMTD